MKKNPRDKASGLPKAYVKGLSASTAKARKAHWKKMDKLSDRDPRAYEPAPGDATAKTKPSKATKEVRRIMNKEEIEITEAAESSLAAKAKKFNVPLGTLKTVYRRGVAAWNSGHRPGTTPQQWGHARVNSYLRKGKGTYHGADKDLREEKDQREYGYEGEMAMSQLKGIMNHAKQMHDMLEPSTDLPEWVQSKITLAYDYIQTAADYMATEMNEEIDKGLEDELMSQRQSQSGKKWRVTRANKTIGTYNSKDKADVKAMKHPLNKVVANEEVQIDELSKDTLKSYNKKAFTQYTNMTHGPTDWNKQSDKVRDKAAQRMRGMNMADRKLKKEEAQLDELSKDTLKSYVNKADARLMDRTIDNPKAHKKAQNRTFGIEKAVKKIREETAVNSVGAGNVAGLQGEPPVHMKKKKKNIMTFTRYTRK